MTFGSGAGWEKGDGEREVIPRHFASERDFIAIGDRSDRQGSTLTTHQEWPREIAVSPLSSAKMRSRLLKLSERSLSFFKFGSKCKLCKDFSTPQTLIYFNDIETGRSNGCLGCRLLADIILHLYKDDTKNVWVSLTPPSSYSSLYHLYINVAGSWELFRLEGMHDR